MKDTLYVHYTMWLQCGGYVQEIVQFHTNKGVLAVKVQWDESVYGEIGRLSSLQVINLAALLASGHSQLC